MKLSQIISPAMSEYRLRRGSRLNQTILCVVFAAVVPLTPAAEELPAPAQPVSVVTSGETLARQPQLLRDGLRSGDKLNLAFYESLASVEDRWAGSQGAVPWNFYQRPELTGEYAVEADGTISVPLLGRFPVRGLPPSDVEAIILPSYESLVGRKGFVNIVKIEHQPIYITGPVRNPGSFRYVDGMTVLHAVAQAGGMAAKTIEPWQSVEITRQIERLKVGLSDLKRLASRTEVLRAKRDSVQIASIGTPVLGPDPDAQRLLDDETWQRQLVTTSKDAQSSAFVKSVADAQTDLDLRQARVGNYDATIRVRQDRLASIENLAKNKLVTSIELTRAQSELTESEDRKQQAVIDVESAKQRLAAAKQDVERDRIERKIEIEKSAADAERGLSTALQTTESDLEIFQSMVSSNDSGDVEFEIVRPGPNGVIVEPATEETVLQPGDLIKVH
ncbi:polysaccharide biosynthesis/export family protein [Rhizobium leguminosarum]|uniref:polysaccharide biosynthesis/export family protein n=1 Tax=Rhizobium leguminosarum TaxID=384 RepID=UPI0021B12133|nr:polysaccharide biosynthesis/export family protein [Rhizobium leguminosarum]